MASTRKRGARVVLAAEEDPKLFGLVCQTLRGDGHRVLAACDAEQTLGVFCEYAWDIDVAFIDISSGLEVISEMLHVRPDMKVLLVCPEDSVPKKTGARDSDFQVMTKPFTFDRLLSTVSSALDGKASPRMMAAAS